MNDTAFKELHLNIKHQNIKCKEFQYVGYEFEKGDYVFVLMLTLSFLKKGADKDENN